MLHFDFLYPFFALIKRYSNNKYHCLKIYNISYKIVGFTLFITIEICKVNYFTQALLKTPLSYFLIHPLLYSNVRFLYSQRSFVRIIPIFYRKIIFNFSVWFIVFLHIFVRISALFNTKNRGTRPSFSCLLYLIFYVALFHPIINLIRNLNTNLCLLLWRQGVACVLQCCEACVF